MGDEELVRQVAQGDGRALAELYDRYSRPVYATGVRLLGDAHMAEELVQDAFTNVWQRAASFDPNRASFATWLYRVTRNRGVALARRRRVRPQSAGEAQLRAISGGPEPEASVDGWDVARALLRIPEEHREVLTLAYFEGLSKREISRRTGARNDQEPDHGRSEEAPPEPAEPCSGGGPTWLRIASKNSSAPTFWAS